MSADRILNRAARLLAGRMHVPPSFLGYRYLPPLRRSAYEVRLIEPETVAHGALPVNIADRNALPRESAKWGFSFYDVPERRVAATEIVTVRNCRVLIARDHWGDPHYAILRGNEQVRVRGTGFDRDLHRPLLSSGESVRKVGRAAWILEQWDRNYSHWLQWHLTKVVLLRKHRPELPVIVPDPLSAVRHRSLQRAGLPDDAMVRLTSNIIDVEELTFVSMDDYRASLLHALRDAVLRDPDPRRKVYISREKAERRHLREEEACWEFLRQRGFERVFMEDYTFDEQVDLMRRTAILVTLHGTGIANMIFAPRGLRVVEIGDASFPNPQFYALASALGHPYWLIRGRALGDEPPGFNDVSVDVGEFIDVMTGVDPS